MTVTGGGRTGPPDEGPGRRQASGGRPTGFCSVRIEVQDYGLLVTVCTNPDVGRRSRDRVVQVGDVEQAFAIVESFLRPWAARHTRPR